MTEKQAVFEFIGKHTQYYWLKLLEGNDAGMRLAVPRKYEKHSVEIESVLNSASIGDKLSVRLMDDDASESGISVVEVSYL